MTSGPGTGGGGDHADATAWSFDVLGPLAVRHDGQPIEVVGVAARVLGRLLVTPGRLVSVDAIAAGLWGDLGTVDARNAVTSYVNRLRKALSNRGGVVPVVTRPPGYVLAVSPEAVDAVRFERLAAQGRRALHLRQPALAAQRLTAAMDLWRGEPYADLADVPFAQAERIRLEAVRLAALEARVDAELAAPGQRASALVAQLESLVARYPHHERFWAQLMTTLYRCGRQADALSAYQRARTRLLDEVAVEPGPELRSVERAVLAEDPALLGIPVAPVTLPLALDHPGALCVGRDGELAALTGALDLAACETGQVRHVLGPPGLGKTHLVTEFARRAAERGVPVRYGLEEMFARPDELAVVIVEDVDRLSPAELDRVVSWLGTGVDRPTLTVLTGAAEPPAALGAMPRIVLPPLSPVEVAEVVRLYASEAADMQALSAVAGAHGIPAQVHRDAARWAAAQASGRVDRAVTHLTDGQRGLRAAHKQIKDGVLDLEHVRARQAVYGRHDRDVPVCPYKGLARFDVVDAAYFHGRDRLVAELVARLVGAPLLALVGASGSGKSSVARAGLLPALAAGVLPGSAELPQSITTPALGWPDLPDGPRIILVDQFEEVFSALAGAQRERFVQRMSEATHGGATLVLTLRSDFFGRCAEHPWLAQLIAANTVLVGPMAADELREAVQAPAAEAGLIIDDGLTELVVDAVRDAAGGLPLLSTALLSLWERRTGRTLTTAAYLAGGGVDGAVEHLGERCFAALGVDAQREAARRILLRLAHSPDGLPLVRRRVPRAELTAAGGAHADTALEALVAGRLVTIADDFVEVSHEALFTRWPRLREWLAEDDTGRRLRAHLTPAAGAWARGGRDPGELYRGTRLAAAVEWSEAHPGELTPTEAQFLQAGRDAATAAQLTQRRTVRRLRGLLAAAAAALVLALSGGGVAVLAQQRADAASIQADAKRLAAQALIEPDPRRALLLAVAATKLDGSAQTRGNLLAALLRNPQLIAAASVAGGDQILTEAISPDGDTLAVGTVSGDIRLFDAATLRQVGSLADTQQAPLSGIAFAADGRRLVSWGGSQANVGQGFYQPAAPIIVWDLSTRRPIGDIFGDPELTGGGLLADGNTLVAQEPNHPKPGASLAEIQARQPPQVQAWDLTTRSRSTRFPVPDGKVDSVSVAADGHTIVLGGPHGVEIVDTATGRSQALSGVRGMPVLSPDGRTLLVVAPGAGQAATYGFIAPPGSADIDVYDVATGARRGTAHRHSGPVISLAWAPDGSSFASVGADRLTVVWDATTLQPRQVFTGHAGPVTQVVYARDGRTLFTAGQDGALLAWDLTETRGMDTLTRPPGPGATYGGYVAPGGRIAAGIGDDGLTHFFDTDTGAERGVPIPTGDDVNNAQFSQNGRYFSVDFADPGVQVFDTSSGRALTARIPLTGRRTKASDVTPDGTVVAVATEQSDGTDLIQWLRLADGKPLGDPVTVPAMVAALQFSPDGRYLLCGLRSGQVMVWETSDRRRVASMDIYPSDFSPMVFAFSPDGAQVAVGGGLGTPSLWRVGSWQRLWAARTGHNGVELSLDFSADGRTLVSSGADGQTILYDTATGQPLGTPMGQTDATWTWSGYLSGHDTIVTIGTDGSIRRWDSDPASWERRACAIAGRDLTTAEWKALLPNLGYRHTCTG